MAYSLADDVYTVLPGISPTTTAASVLSVHIAQADGIINAYLSRRYSTPFGIAATVGSTVPPIIRSLSYNLAGAYYYRSYFTKDNANTSEYAEAMESKQIELLKLIMGGQMDITDSTGSVVAERDSDSKVASTTMDYAPVFDVDTATAWKVDADRLDAIAEDRD